MASLLKHLRVGRSDEPPTAVVMNVQGCQKAMERACRDLGVDRITHHDLRHFFATSCIEAGIDIPTVSRWLGHKDGGALAMRVYGQLRDQHSQAMAQRVTFGLVPGGTATAHPQPPQPHRWECPRPSPNGIPSPFGDADLPLGIGQCLRYTAPMDRITLNPEQCGGRPCIRGLRIRVKDVLEMLAEGASADEILRDYPDLEVADIRACLAYAARYFDHPVLAAA